MRTIAIVFNLCLLGFTVFYGLQEGFELEGLSILFIALIIVAPLVSLVALFLQGPASKDWLARYLARKAQEEHQKVEIHRPASAQELPGVAGAATQTQLQRDRKN